MIFAKTFLSVSLCIYALVSVGQKKPLTKFQVNDTVFVYMEFIQDRFGLDHRSSFSLTRNETEYHVRNETTGDWEQLNEEQLKALKEFEKLCIRPTCFSMSSVYIQVGLKEKTLKYQVCIHVAEPVLKKLGIE